jgi:hypothetical protein
MVIVSVVWPEGRFRWGWSSRICSSSSGLLAYWSPQSGQAGLSVLGMSASFGSMESGGVGVLVR